MSREERQLGRLAGIRAAPTRLQGGDTGAASLLPPIGESPARGRSRVPSPIKRTQRACCEGCHTNNHPHCPCWSPSSMPHSAPQRWGLGRENSPSRFWPDGWWWEGLKMLKHLQILCVRYQNSPLKMRLERIWFKKCCESMANSGEREVLALTQSDQSRRPYPLRAYCAQAGTGIRGSDWYFCSWGLGIVFSMGQKAEVQGGPAAGREQTDLSHSG